MVSNQWLKWLNGCITIVIGILKRLEFTNLDSFSGPMPKFQNHEKKSLNKSYGGFLRFGMIRNDTDTFQSSSIWIQFSSYKPSINHGIFLQKPSIWWYPHVSPCPSKVKGVLSRINEAPGGHLVLRRAPAFGEKRRIFFLRSPNIHVNYENSDMSCKFQHVFPKYFPMCS